MLRPQGLGWLHKLLLLLLLLGGCLAGKVLGLLCSCQCRFLGLLLGFLGCFNKGFGRGLTWSKGWGLVSKNAKTHLNHLPGHSSPVRQALKEIPRVQMSCSE